MDGEGCRFAGNGRGPAKKRWSEPRVREEGGSLSKVSPGTPTKLHHCVHLGETGYFSQFAPYLITDSVEDGLIDGTNKTGVNPGLVKAIPDQGDPTGPNRYGIPLIIQEKTFVPQDVGVQDSAWDTVNWGQYGDLCWPHILEPNQSQTSPDGVNPYGRWDYGPWVWPNITAPISDPNAPPMQAALPLPNATTSHPWAYTTCAVPESFMDTPVINGTAYPFLTVQPKAYRFRILNACNDRMLNPSMGSG